MEADPKVESLVDAEVAVRNAMVQNSQDNKLYAILAQMQRKLLKLARQENKKAYGA